MLRPDFFISWFTDFFSDLGLGGWEKRKKNFENDLLTGHFQSFFSFSEQTVKLVK